VPTPIQLAADQLAVNIPQRDAQMVLDDAGTSVGAGQGFIPGSGNEGQVTALASPGMAVRVQVGTSTAYDNAGQVKAIPTSSNLAISAADATNPRVDAVVLNAAGALTVRAGTPNAQPAPPNLSGADILLALVNVAANATDIQAGNIVDARNRKPIDGKKIKDGTIPTSAFQAWPRSQLFGGNGSDTKFSLTGPKVSSANNGYFGVRAFRNGLRINNVTPNVPSGLDEYRVIEESNVTKVELGAALPGGQNLLVDWTG